MKKSILVFALAVLCAPALFAKVITVSNDPNSPGQYKTLPDAIAAASAGDTLLVSGTPTDYDNVGTFDSRTGNAIFITKPLTLLGQGYDPRNDQPFPSTITTLVVTAAASGSVISGFSIPGFFYSQPGTNNIVVSRCKMANFGNPGYGLYGVNGSFYDVRNNIINNIVIADGIGSVIIQNNIITGILSNSINDNNITVVDDLFTINNVYNIYNATLVNNIFYSKSTSSLSYAYISSGTKNCVFTNNMYFNTTNADPLNLTTNGNSGSGNINADPQFTAYDLSTTNVTRTDNFTLLAGSPATGTGINGKDMGVQGGYTPIQYPYSGAPAIPQMQAVTIANPVIAPNGTLNVNIQARSNN